MRKEPRYTVSSRPSRQVVVEANQCVGDVAEGFRPLAVERQRAAGRGDGRKASALEHQLVEFTFADDDGFRFREHRLPIVELRVRARRGEHLRAVRRTFGVFSELAEREISVAVNDRDDDTETVPAKKMAVNDVIRNSARVAEVGTDAREAGDETPG